MTNYDILKEYEAHKTPVPSYEEWKELKEASDGLSKLMFKSLMNMFVKADEERERLADENQQLKELLKECHSGFRKLPIYNLVGEDEAREVNKLLNKITNALGEKKCVKMILESLKLEWQ